MHDASIEQHLTEKLKLFSSITASVTGVSDTSTSERHLLRGSAAEPLQRELLLTGALKDGEICTAQYRCVNFNQINFTIDRLLLF